MKEELTRLLAEHGVTSVTVDRDASIHGRPAFGIGVEYVQNGKQKSIGFEFAKDNAMTTENMAKVIISHL